MNPYQTTIFLLHLGTAVFFFFSAYYSYLCYRKTRQDTGMWILFFFGSVFGVVWGLTGAPFIASITHDYFFSIIILFFTVFAVIAYLHFLKPFEKF